MHRKRAFVLGLGTAVALVTVPLLVSCLSDPRADDADVPAVACDVNTYKTTLSATPTSPEATLRTFVEASLELKAASDEVETQLKDACNALAAEVGMPQGADVTAACKPLADRVDAINATAPPALAPNAFPAEVRIAKTCTAEPGALEACITACGGTACTQGKCEPNTRSQKCAGTCNGTCIQKAAPGAAIPCTGKCVGDIPLEAPLGCGGQCTGICTAPAWTGKCAGACAGTFVGVCAGTCTGLCNNAPVNQAALADAGPPTPPVTNPPDNAPGNCNGLCQGTCSSGSEGFCTGYPCYDPKGGPTALTLFSGSCTVGTGGECIGIPGQPALCRSAEGTGSTTVCAGTCEVPSTGTCDGLCVGDCQGTATEVTCSSPPNCGQNLECTNACSALVAVRAKCSESTFEAYALHDPVLLAGWEKIGARFTQPVQRLGQLRAALGYIGQRTYGDFVSIGLKGPFIRSCVEFGNKSISAASDKVNILTSVNATARR